MKRYVVFAGDNYYPNGGWRDVHAQFDSEDEARAEVLRHPQQWQHYIDTAADNPVPIEQCGCGVLTGPTGKRAENICADCEATRTRKWEAQTAWSDAYDAGQSVPGYCTICAKPTAALVAGVCISCEVERA